MKHHTLGLTVTILIMIIAVSCTRQSQNDPTSIRAISYNIKFDDKSDTVNSWNQRKEQVINLISFYDPDFLGTQEALLHQLEDLEKGLGTMAWIGVGRTDGKSDGEFSALFYDTEEYELIADTDSTIWLSETPSEPSKSWDAALPRILTWGKFRSKNSGKEFYVFNTHFDHIGDTARAESARLIVDTINKITADLPVIITGDFNAVEESEPYRNLTNPPSGLKDAFYATKQPHVGPLFSYDGFNVLSGDEDSRRRIDYIFVNDKVEVQRHAFISNFRDGRYPSDHLPVLADIKINLATD